eukprot:38119-Rhodomonas_salina.3
MLTWLHHVEHAVDFCQRCQHFLRRVLEGGGSEMGKQAEEERCVSEPPQHLPSHGLHTGSRRTRARRKQEENQRVGRIKAASCNSSSVRSLASSIIHSRGTQNREEEDDDDADEEGGGLDLISSCAPELIIHRVSLLVGSTSPRQASDMAADVGGTMAERFGRGDERAGGAGRRGRGGMQRAGCRGWTGREDGLKEGRRKTEVGEKCGGGGGGGDRGMQKS